MKTIEELRTAATLLLNTNTTYPRAELCRKGFTMEDLRDLRHHGIMYEVGGHLRLTDTGARWNEDVADLTPLQESVLKEMAERLSTSRVYSAEALGHGYGIRAAHIDAMVDAGLLFRPAPGVYARCRFGIPAGWHSARDLKEKHGLNTSDVSMLCAAGVMERAPSDKGFKCAAARLVPKRHNPTTYDWWWV